MKLKLSIQIISIIFAILTFLSLTLPNNISAQACSPENACMCNPDDPNCCATEGDGGYNCGCGDYNCSGPTPAPGGGGGGGDQNFDPMCPQIVNCPNPPGTNFNAEVTYWSTQKVSCNLGTAQAYNGCVTTNAEGVNGCDYQRISTFACCPAGTQSECHWVPAPSGTYTLQNSCATPTNCNGDTYISHTGTCGLLGPKSLGTVTTTCQQSATYQTTGTCFQWATGCYPGTVISWYPDPALGVCYYDSEGGANVYNIRLTCGKPDVRVCSCTPTCNQTAPSTPSLLSPANGSTISVTNVSLMWNNLSQTWGTACNVQNNQFSIYVGTNPSSLGLIGTV